MSNQKKRKKKKRRWSKTAKRYTTVAVIAALIGICLDIFAVTHFSDDTDYSRAVQVTSKKEMSKLEDYTGKVIIQGTLTGTPYTFDEAYKNVEMKKKPEVDGEYIYTELVLTRPEKYVKNKKDVRTKHVAPEYDYHNRHYRYVEQAKDLNIYGLAIELNDPVGLTDFGKLYKTLKEKAELQGIKGSEAEAVVYGKMENGTLSYPIVEINGTIDDAIGDAKGGLMVFHVMLAVWLGLCGLVVLSMYVQRYK